MIVHEFNINKELYDVSKAFEAHEKNADRGEIIYYQSAKKMKELKIVQLSIFLKRKIFNKKDNDFLLLNHKIASQIIK